MTFDLLPTLRPRQWRSTICVRVCRKWEYRGGTDDGPVQHVDLVLLDEKGNSMYGEIPEPEVEDKSPLLQEGGIYVISRFRISNAKSGYKPVNCPYMIEVTLHTTISVARTDMPDFPEYAYNITPIDALSSHVGDTRNFLDTIGLLVEVSEAYRVRLPNKPAPILTRHIVLRDLSYYEMKITLWGHRAAAFTTSSVYNRSEATPVTVLFVGGLMKSYQGTYYLSGNAASRWYFNPPIPEAHQIQASCQGQRVEIRFVPAPREEQGQARVPAQRAEKTLRELNEMDPYDFANNGYRCNVTVGRLVPNASWWFPSCTKCSKSCVPDGTGYRCNACSNTSFKFKYKISFIALDGTDEAEMICFGDVARRIIGKSVQQLLRTATNSTTYPPEVARIVSLRFTFAVALTQQSYYRHQKTYQVVSVVTAYGRQPVAAAPVESQNAEHSDSGGDNRNISQNTSQDVENVSDVALSSPLLTDTTPPPAVIGEPPSVESKLCDASGKAANPSSRKRLTFPDETPDELPDKDSEEKRAPTAQVDDSTTVAAQNSGAVGKDAAPEKKRSRGEQPLVQESG